MVPLTQTKQKPASREQRNKYNAQAKNTTGSPPSNQTRWKAGGFEWLNFAFEYRETGDTGTDFLIFCHVQEISDKVKAAEVVEKTSDVNKKTIAAAKTRLAGFLKFDADDQLLS